MTEPVNQQPPPQISHRDARRATGTHRKPSRGELRQWKREQERLAWEQRLAMSGVRNEADLEAFVRGQRQINFIKWGLGFTGVGLILFTVLTMLVLIITPAWFRSLPTSEQVIWEGRIPFLAAFQPTKIYNADRLPTSETNSTDDGAMALLQDPVSSPTFAPTNSGLAAGSGDPASTLTATPTPSTGGLPFLASNPSGRPTSVLATNTPVLAPVQATATLQATAIAAFASPTATLTLPPPPIPTSIPIPSTFQTVGLNYQKQGWNECGPANLTQVLKYFNWSGNLRQVVDYLKPNVEDRNVSPWEMVSFVNDNLNTHLNVPLKAMFRVGGDLELVKRLVANGFGVILEKGYFVAGEGWMGHYLTIQGYDDSRGQIHGMDTYLGDRWEKYDELDVRWQQFNRTFIVVYPQDRERELSVMLGPYKDVAASVSLAYGRAKEEASVQPDNPYAWFNLGSSLTQLGDYEKAARAFDKALNTGGGLPPRMLWYQFTPYEAYYNAGDYTQVRTLAEATLGTSSDLEESHYWRAMALAAQGNFDAAINDLNKALSINSQYQPAIKALVDIKAGLYKPPR